MKLYVLEQALREVYKKIDTIKFSELIRECRDALGMKQYRAAEFMGISQYRLKNLETGYFREMPKPGEINAIARLFNIKFSVLEYKAITHVNDRLLERKIRVIYSEEEIDYSKEEVQ